MCSTHFDKEYPYRKVRFTGSRLSMIAVTLILVFTFINVPRLFSSKIDINEIPVYRYMYKKADGKVAMGEIDATTPVKEIDNGQASIEVVERCYTDKMTRLFMGACSDTETTIYLPKDSIVKDFDIDVTK